MGGIFEVNTIYIYREEFYFRIINWNEFYPNFNKFTRELIYNQQIIHGKELLIYFPVANSSSVQFFWNDTWGIVSDTCRCDAMHSFEEFNSGCDERGRCWRVRDLFFPYVLPPLSARSFYAFLRCRSRPRSIRECNFRARLKNPAQCGTRHVRHRYNSFDETVEMPSPWLLELRCEHRDPISRALFVFHLDRFHP